MRCSKSFVSSGSFRLDFASSGGVQTSKIDFHQIGGRFGGHFWFAHTRTSAFPEFEVKGTWSLGSALDGWARVLVHMPDHGAHTQQARYRVNLGDGRWVERTLLQRTLEHRWVPLGTFEFAGVPEVTLTSRTSDGVGEEDVAWDAIAIQPLTAKPKNFVVALGDSYSAGEGASVAGGGDYYRETDNNGSNPFRNACHRSRKSWSRLARLGDSTSTTGARADALDPSLDYHMLACSGAQTENLLASDETTQNAFGERAVGQHGELSQLDRGFQTS